MRAWAADNDTNKQWRSVLCGYAGEQEMPAIWSMYRWDHAKGMCTTEKNWGREWVQCSPAIRPLDRLKELVRVG